MKNFKFLDLIHSPKGIVSLLAFTFLFVLQSSTLFAQNCNNASNPEFDNGTSDWILSDNGGAVGAYTIDSGNQLSGPNSAKNTISNPGTAYWHLQLYQGSHAIQSSKTYDLSFEAKAGANKIIYFRIQEASAPWTTYYGSSAITVTSTANTYTISGLPVSATDGSARIMFEIGNNTTPIWLDNIVFKESTCTTVCNVLGNEEFDNGTSDWSFYATSPAAGNFSIDNTSQISGINSGKVAISAINTADAHIQLIQSGVSLTAGDTYDLSFKAKASGNKAIKARLLLHTSPYTTYWSQTFNLTSNVKTFSIQGIDPNITSSNIRFRFELGNDTDDVWIDDVVLAESSCDNSNGQINYSCDDGKTLEHYGASCNNGSVSIGTIPNIGQIESQSIEVVYKGCNPGSSITVTGTGGQTYTLNEVALTGNSPSVHSYRGTFTNPSSTLTHTAVCGACQSNSGLQSILSFNVRNVDQQRYYALNLWTRRDTTIS